MIFNLFKPPLRPQQIKRDSANKNKLSSTFSLLTITESGFVPAQYRLFRLAGGPSFPKEGKIHQLMDWGGWDKTLYNII